MDKNFIGERISELRLKKNVSEYQMSLDLGKNKSYSFHIKVEGDTSSPSLPDVLCLPCRAFWISVTIWKSLLNSSSIQSCTIFL